MKELFYVGKVCRPELLAEEKMIAVTTVTTYHLPRIVGGKRNGLRGTVISYLMAGDKQAAENAVREEMGIGQTSVEKLGNHWVYFPLNDIVVIVHTQAVEYQEVVIEEGQTVHNTFLNSEEMLSHKWYVVTDAGRMLTDYYGSWYAPKEIDGMIAKGVYAVDDISGERAVVCIVPEETDGKTES